MINFSRKELDYIIEGCLQVKKYKEGLEQMTIDKDVDYTKDYIESIGQDTVNNIYFILENYVDVLKNYNTDKYINKKLADTIYWIDGLWVWVDSGFTTAEEMRNYIDDDISCGIFEKIMNEETEDGEETDNQKGIWKWISELTRNS